MDDRPAARYRRGLFFEQGPRSAVDAKTDHPATKHPLGALVTEGKTKKIYSSTAAPTW